MIHAAYAEIAVGHGLAVGIHVSDLPPNVRRIWCVSWLTRRHVQAAP